LALAVLAIAAVAVMIIYALRPMPVLADFVKVQRGPMMVAVQDDGITRIRERYVVSSPLNGRLLRISFDVGDMVTAGNTVLARMQPTDPDLLDPRAVAQAQARVSAAERRLEGMKAELAKAEAALDFAELELGRLQRLRSQSAVASSELEQAKFFFQARQQEARAAGFNVDIAEYELQLQRAALLLTKPLDEANDPNRSAPPPKQSASTDGNTAEEMELAIVSPIDGRILRIYQESTAVVLAGSPLLEIGDPSDLEVVVDVLSRDAVQIDPGDPVLLENWGQPEPLRGQVRRVEPSGFTKVSALGVEEQRVNVIIDIQDPPRMRAALGDNFRVDAKIIIWQQTEVLQVPTSALFRVGQQWTVFRVDGDSKAVAQAVTVGRNNGSQAEILDGLEAGQVVIAHPGDSIANGVTVANRADLE
jgi:HlyD family secretion protein